MTIRVANIEVDTRHFIGGERCASHAAAFQVFSPIDGATLGEVSAGNAADVDQAVSAAKAAFPAWAALGPIGRGEILDRFASAILEQREELSIVETVDNGSLLIGNRKRVIDRAAHNIGYFSKLARTLRHEPSRGHTVDNHVRYEPAGVAALVTPWNAPLMLSTWKLGPALAAGNTVVLKPPEWAPLSCSLLAEIGSQAGIPRGVFNVVQGTGSEAGQALLENADVARVSFTGSTATGRVVLRAAAQNVTPVSVELGGKSPFLVFADADLTEAASTVAAQFNNAGQVCLAGTRVLVDASVESEFRALVLAATKQFVVGDPRERGVRVGPLIHPRQLERVAGYVERALQAGAVPLVGGGPHPRGGLYYQPTILTDVHQDSEIVQHEVFGPVLTWQTFRTEDEAVALANGTRYGLAAVLYTRSPERAERVAARLCAGTVWVNCFFARDLDVPFGGARESGIGREGGKWSFDFFCDVKNVAIQRGTFAPARPAADGSEREPSTMTGRIVATAIVAHQPMVMVPERVRIQLGGTGADTSLIEPGYRRLREMFAELGVNTFVIVDTHWFTTTEHVIAGAANFSGRYTSEEMPRNLCDVPYDYPGAPELAQAWHEVNKQRGLNSVNVTTPSLPQHYPTINLVHHLRTSEKVLSCGVLQTASMNDYLALGRALEEAVCRVPGARVAVLGSGGMSHEFWPLEQIRDHFGYDAAHVISPEAREIDARILELWGRGEHAAVLDLYPAYLRRFHPEGRFAHYLMALGAIGARSCTLRGVRLSEYENAVGTGQVHVLFRSAGVDT